MPEPASERIDETVPVLVVGGGLVGLSTALFLAAHGVPPLLVEKHPDLLIHPRARGFSPRTVELFREVGLGRAIRDAGYADPDRFRWVAVRAETLAGEHAPVPEPTTAGFDEASPASFAPIDQDVLERLIRAKVEALGGDLRFSTELVRFGRDGAGVAALVRDRRTGEERTIHADYLVAADGHASPIRQTLGIGVDGPGPFFDILTATIDADLRPALRGRTASIAYLERPRPGTSLLAHDETGRRWVFGLGYAADRETPADYPDERIAGLVREAAGLDGVAVTLRPQIPGTDLKVLGWTIGAHLARAYRSGPVFLAGDAAHAVPPTGGFGANLGIQDAHNLAWKLAAVLRGQAGPGLLATYEAERRPVASLTMGQALARWQARSGVGEVAAAPLLDYAAVAMGYRYRSAAVLGAEHGGPEAFSPTDLTGQPGTRAPHLWLERGGERISTLDLFGRRFVLFAGADGVAWIGAANRVAARLDIALDACRLGDGLRDPEDRWPVAFGVTAAGAVLVRPDGVVAWRAEAAEEDPEATLERVLDVVLARTDADFDRAATGDRRP